jgi:ABC-type sugar transport system ATPase subunit
MARVILEQVSKTYAGGIEAVREVSLQVEDGELVTVVGPSGSGKTTLLRLIAGLETPSYGSIRIGECIVTDMPPHRRDVAMVFQRPALYPHLSVSANLGFGLRLRQGGVWRRWLRRPTVEVQKRITAVARQLGLESVMERRPATLSGGQQQRVALGRALVRRPAVFLLDEPLGNLDARLRLEMRRELHLLQRRLRATMIFVTHDQDEALALGERVVVLDQGQVRQADRPEVVYDRPADRFVAGFLGWPPMSLLAGELIAVEDRLRFANGEVGLVMACRPDWRSFAGRPLLLGIRPENVRLAEGPGEGQLRMEVCLLERLGPVCLATLTAASWTVTARWNAAAAVSEGANVFAEFDLSRAHLFDPASGRALSHGLGERGV